MTRCDYCHLDTDREHFWLYDGTKRICSYCMDIRNKKIFGEFGKNQ